MISVSWCKTPSPLFSKWWLPKATEEKIWRVPKLLPKAGPWHATFVAYRCDHWAGARRPLLPQVIVAAGGGLGERRPFGDCGWFCCLLGGYLDVPSSYIIFYYQTFKFIAALEVLLPDSRRLTFSRGAFWAESSEDDLSCSVFSYTSLGGSKTAWAKDCSGQRDLGMAVN